MERKRKHYKRERNVECSDGDSHALQTWERKSAQKGFQDTASETSESNKKTMHASIVEAHESTRKRVESTPPRSHEDHIVERRFNSLSHCNLVRKFVPMSRAMNIPDAKAPVDKEWRRSTSCQRDN